jgi:hypothetical protein
MGNNAGLWPSFEEIDIAPYRRMVDRQWSASNDQHPNSDHDPKAAADH